MIWRLRYASVVKRQLREVDSGDVRRRIAEILTDLQNDPFPSDSLRLRGTRDDYRIRVEPYRIIYRVHRSHGVVRILRVEVRSERTYRGYNPEGKSPWAAGA